MMAGYTECPGCKELIFYDCWIIDILKGTYECPKCGHIRYFRGDKVVEEIAHE